VYFYNKLRSESLYFQAVQVLLSIILLVNKVFIKYLIIAGWPISIWQSH